MSIALPFIIQRTDSVFLVLHFTLYINFLLNFLIDVFGLLHVSTVIIYNGFGKLCHQMAKSEL